MTWEMGTVFVLVLISFGAMVWEKISVDLVAMAAFSLLLLLGILTPREAFQVFGNEAVITVACMFILSAALERTGVIEAAGRRLNALAGPAGRSLLLMMLPVVVLLSAFVNNTPVVVVFMPIMIALAVQRELKPSKLLIPLSYAAIFGGVCTLIGTSTNILVSSILETKGFAPFGMFELTLIGPVLAAAGMIYLLTLGYQWLPDRETLASLLQSTVSKQYLTEAVIGPGSPLIGKRLLDTPLKSLPNARILDVTRGLETLSTPLNEILLAEGDRLRLTTVLSSVMEIKGLKGIDILPATELGLEPLGTEKAAVVECVIGPNSELIGKTLRQINFRQRYGVLILAVHRQGVNLREGFGEVRLHFGDTLLIEGTQGAINQLRDNRNFLMLADVPHAPPRRAKMWLAVLAVGAVVSLAALNVLPIATLAIVAALAVVLGGCLEADEAYAAIQWKILFVIFGMLSLGIAMEKTKGAEWIADNLIGVVAWAPSDLRPLATLALMYLCAMVLTELLSNNAVAVLLTPVAINVALELQVDPRPFVIAVAIAASAGFASPIGYQTHMLVYGPGGYKFRDFVKVGLPLDLLFWILATLLIPVFWPLK